MEETTPASLLLQHQKHPRCEVDDDFIVEILSWVSVRSLLRFQTVCKSWRAIISESYFVQKHLNHATLILKLQFVNFSRSDMISQIRAIDLQGNLHSCIHQHHDSPPEKYHDHDLRRILGSSNGLICVQDESRAYSEYFSDEDDGDGYGDIYDVGESYSNKSDEFFICNLSTKIVNKLPKQTTTKGRGRAYHEFGYDPTTQDYKLILGDSWTEKTRITIFSFKTGSWRAWEENSKEFSFDPMWFGTGCLVKGALHWMDYIHDDCRVNIISFDLGREKLQQLCHLELKHTSPSFNEVKIANIRDCLYLYSFDSDQRSMPITIWMMKEYGVDQPWTKLMQVPTHSIPCNNNYCVNPILHIIEDGEILVTLSHYSDVKWFIYNPQEDKFTPTLEFVPSSQLGDAQLYFETLVKPEFSSGI